MFFYYQRPKEMFINNSTPSIHQKSILEMSVSCISKCRRKRILDVINAILFISFIKTLRENLWIPYNIMWQIAMLLHSL